MTSGGRQTAGCGSFGTLVVIAVIVGTGCSNEGADGANGSGGATGNGGALSGGSSSSGGSSGAIGGQGTGGGTTSVVVPPTAAVPRNAGTLRGRLRFEQDFGEWRIHAAFDSQIGFREYGFACHLSTFAGCEVDKCGFPAGNAQGTLYHPGTLTLQNETTGKTAVIEPLATPGSTAHDVYPAVTESILTLSPGDHLHVSAAGTAEVAAFQASLVVPAKLGNPTSTCMPKGVATNSFVGANGLGFGWDSSEGLALVQFSYGPYGFDGFNPSFNAIAFCAYSRSGGTAGLSGDVIGHVGCASNTITVLSAYSEQQLTAGNYAVTVQIADPAGLQGYIDCKAN